MNPLVPAVLALFAAASAWAAKPNIVLFVADDMGFADCGLTGCKDIPTPNIDALAKNAPPGSEGVVTLIKQGVVNVNRAYDQIAQGTKQLVEMMETNANNAAKAATAARKR